MNKPSPQPETPPRVAPLDAALGVLLRFQRFAWDVGGVFLITLALMTLLALVLPRLTGGVLAAWADFLRLWLGWGSAFVVVGLGVAGLLLLRRRAAGGEPPAIRWRRVFSLETAALALLAFFAVAGGIALENAETGAYGGRVGWGLAEMLHVALTPIGLGGTASLGVLLGSLALFTLFYGLGWLSPLGRRLRRWAGEPATLRPETEPAVSVAPAAGSEASPAQAGMTSKKRSALPPEFRKKLSFPSEKTVSASPPPPRDEHLPPLDILSGEASARQDERSINETAGLIEKTLAEFGIPAKVIGFKAGPTVTQFAVEPGFIEKAGSDEEEIARQKVRVAQISGLQRDLALALAAERLRIEAPVPGRPYVGIEVPNARSSTVRLRPILESEAFYRYNSPLAVALGRDVSGQPVVADLERMPHLLIAGTTGSGKSVCIAALTLCLVMNNTPEDLRLLMIDPKMVELIRFNGLPHLFGKVETDLQRILGVLQWTVAEMDRRYKLLEELHARNIESYNRKARRRKGGVPLPRLVLMIDELADLMMSAPDQTEPMLIRLAQLARATGIHLVVATQRPSTDVVTGLIKANFPARLSFSVASSVDSRVILDTGGAESLLGHGDMLFLPPDIGSPLRAQGVMVSDGEVEKVITFWQQAHPRDEKTPPPWEQMLTELETMADRDNLVEKAVAFVRQSQRASASLLQRHLRIGYPRAARLMDELEELGVVGPSQGGGREREVLVEREEGEEDSDQ